MSNSVLYFFVVLIWGTTWLAVKWQLGNAPAEISVFYRFALAFLVLFIFCKIKKLSLSFSFKENALLLLLGICIFSVHVLLFYKAAGYLISGCVSVLFSFVSVFNILNASIFLRRRPSRNMLSGAGLGLLGLIIFFWRDIRVLSFEEGALKGIVYGLLGSCLFSMGTILSRSFQHGKLPLIPSSTVAIGYGSGILFLYCLLTGCSFSFPLSVSYWGLLVYLGAVVSAIGFVSFLSLVSRLGPERAGYATVLFPVIALFLSVVFESYTFSIIHFLGIGFVIGGNILLNSKRPKTIQQVTAYKNLSD